MNAATLAGAAGLLAALVTALFLTFGNTYKGISCRATPTGQPDCVEESSTAVEQNGRWVLLVFALPVILSGVVFVSVLPRVKWDKYAGRTAAVGLLLFCVVLLISFGLLFLPALVLDTIALVLHKPRAAAT